MQAIRHGKYAAALSVAVVSLCALAACGSPTTSATKSSTSTPAGSPSAGSSSSATSTSLGSDQLDAASPIHAACPFLPASELNSAFSDSGMTSQEKPKYANPSVVTYECDYAIDGNPSASLFIDVISNDADNMAVSGAISEIQQKGTNIEKVPSLGPYAYFYHSKDTSSLLMLFNTKRYRNTTTIDVTLQVGVGPAHLAIAKDAMTKVVSNVMGRLPS